MLDCFRGMFNHKWDYMANMGPTSQSLGPPAPWCSVRQKIRPWEHLKFWPRPGKWEWSLAALLSKKLFAHQTFHVYIYMHHISFAAKSCRRMECSLDICLILSIYRYIYIYIYYIYIICVWECAQYWFLISLVYNSSWHSDPAHGCQSSIQVVGEFFHTWNFLLPRKRIPWP